MPDEVRRFSYTARNTQGAMVSGTISADNETAAARRLQSMGLAPLSLRATGKNDKGTGLQRQIGRAKRVKAKHLAVFSRQFATMSNAGLPLVRTMKAIGDQTDHPELRRVLPLVRGEVEAGQAMSVALSKHPLIFPPLMVGMVAAGEVSGSLGDAMYQVADNYDKEAKLRAKVFAAMIYPGIVLGMSMVMVTGMLLFVVPRFQKIFTQLGGELPLLTRILIQTSEIAKYAIPLLAVAGFLFSFWWRKHKHDRSVRNIIDPIKLRLPIFGKFFQKIAIARFARTFSSLLSSGVPMLQSLDIVSATAGSIIISDALTEVRSAVRAGKPVAATLKEHPIFPSQVVEMIGTGEETGRMPDMLNRVAEFYENEVDIASDALTATLEPVMIVILASIVGTMVISLYLPVFKVFELVK